MSDLNDSQLDSVSVDTLREINRMCVDFERAWRDGQSPQIESFAGRISEDARAAAIRELIAQEVDLRWAAGQPAEPEEYHNRFPLYARAVNEAFSLLRSRHQSNRQLSNTDSLLNADASEADNNRSQGCANRDEPTPDPGQFGRFEIQRRLGRGAFADVYLAFDPQLQRRVAIKVPRRERFSSPADMDIFVQEARTAAGLTHAGIVTIHDVVRDGDALLIVQEYVEGQDLANFLAAQNSALPAEQIVRVLTSIAEALSFAHQKGFVHRDLKPANILLDVQLRPRIADFGLAVHETVQRRRRGEQSGTPAYMSPEQVRGETHRLDGRSDIWSLGVILYELLTGHRPFQGENREELFDEIKHRDPSPPRQRRPSVPAELDRICLKCLNKRVTDRYPSAADLLDDLRHWSAPQSSARQLPASVKIVPKGLLSFDAGDADFFLDLVPGARDRDGLPESIRFWKTRLEEMDADHTFAVGLVYGPSGCGKSSLVKAGLIPRLAPHVLSIYVEATSADTEVRLLKGLRKACPAIPAEASLPEVCESLRAGFWLPKGRKVVLVLDQFEQWLHVHNGGQDTELVTALRHCDGGRLQAVVMVRDDFAMAASRFMRALDTRIIEGHNFDTMDLFDVTHAASVLRMFGQAFGRLPANAGQMSADEQSFVHNVVTGLAQDGKVVSVRLALFAEMVKTKPWTARTLAEVGGTQGIGVNFLEETFSSREANPDHRLHAVAARGVLKALLPELGTDIRGGMRSQSALQEAAGYLNRPLEFAELLRILDSELRLITPADLEGENEGKRLAEEEASGVSSSIPHPASVSYYQLTHDYLVPSLREWLTRKQRETLKGRAELKLSELSTLWNSKPENRHLPSLTEWLTIRVLTDSGKWTEQQRIMMGRARRIHGLRTGFVTVATLAIVAIGIFVRGQVLQQQENTRIRGLINQLVSAGPAEVPDIARELEGYLEVATGYLTPLHAADAKTVDEKRSQLHARLAMVARDKSLVEPLLEELLTNRVVAYVGPIRQQLRPYASELLEELWHILRNDKAESNRRLRAALALADYVPETERASWTEQDLQFVARQLVMENAEFQPLLRENLRPISGRLLPELEKIFGNADGSLTDEQRLSAANAFVDYAANDMARLSRLLTVATPKQYAVIFPLVAANPAQSTIDDLSKIAATLPAPELGSVERVPFGQRRANAAVALLRLSEYEKVLPVFEMTDDPEALTQFIFRCRDRGVRVEELLECLRIVNDGPLDRFPSNTRYALLLALGEYTLDEIPESQRDAILKQLSDWYRNDPSSGVHGAAGWLLRRWGQNDVVRQVDQTAVPYAPDREWFTLAITVTPKPLPKPADEVAAPKAETQPDPPANGAASRDESTSQKNESVSGGPAKDEAKPDPMPPRTFYFTFIVFQPGGSQIGSVEDEPLRSTHDHDEHRHLVHLTRPFALLDREVTLEEMIAFTPSYAGFMDKLNAKPSDAGYGVNWYSAVRFCRWLTQQSGMSESLQPYPSPNLLSKEEYPREPTPSESWAPRNWPLALERRGFRLPTESEWEIASRAGTRTAFGNGSDVALLGKFGWFQGNSGRKVHSTRELCPSLRGAFDLHGNLIEWTHDWYAAFGESTVTDPRGPKEGSFRVNRGGSFENFAADCRSAVRYTHDPALRGSVSGFRLALTLPDAFNPAEQRAELP